MIYHVERFDSLSSTNDYLKQLAESGAPEGTVVIAEEQTAGKGRVGRSWTSPKGGAWFSVLLKPPIPVEQAGCISLVIAVSLARALRERWGVPAGVKWPNDLYVSHKKLGGILIELCSQAQKIEWLVAGVGINVNNEPPANTRVPATSLARELGRTLSLEEFFDVALDVIAQDYERFLTEGFEFVRQQWEKLSILGEHVIVCSPLALGEGPGERSQVLGLSESGKLIVRVGESIRELSAEEVTLVPDAEASGSEDASPLKGASSVLQHAS
ncbi:MAG: biotin--[acetyl-CoA-carboxylase] ligase, partial [Candidatus Bipolaricaulota bacterium]|nr:biotin--[acetyl-CoA-carboxylase] ligase [Candidatus Bipolaricaulota bacterium]